MVYVGETGKGKGKRHGRHSRMCLDRAHDGAQKDFLAALRCLGLRSHRTVEGEAVGISCLGQGRNAVGYVGRQRPKAVRNLGGKCLRDTRNTDKQVRAALQVPCVHERLR
jgi:hypothetical protein